MEELPAKAARLAGPGAIPCAYRIGTPIAWCLGRIRAWYEQPLEASGQAFITAIRQGLDGGAPGHQFLRTVGDHRLVACAFLLPR